MVIDGLGNEPKQMDIGIKGQRIVAIENDIPIVNFNYKDLSLKLYCVNTGVPHCIAYIDEPVYDFELEKIGPLVEKHEKFPQGVNFEIVNIVAIRNEKGINFVNIFVIIKNE